MGYRYDTSSFRDQRVELVIYKMRSNKYLAFKKNNSFIIVILIIHYAS